jgi:hypothetical protein
MDKDLPPPTTPESPSSTLEVLQQALPGLRRLVIGGAISSAEELVRLLRQWENELEQLRANPQQNLTVRDDGTPEAPFEFARPRPQEGEADLLRYALIGWMVEAEQRLQRRLDRLDRASRLLHRLIDPWVKPIRSSRLAAPLHQRALRLRSRGEEELQRWIELGRSEELHSRDLARLALKRTVDQNIEYLAHNPAVEELVETQSSGLANEVVEEVRERTVSADTFLEGLARSLLRRAPRSQPPEAPEHIRKRADGIHAAKKSTRKR